MNVNSYHIPHQQFHVTYTEMATTQTFTSLSRARQSSFRHAAHTTRCRHPPARRCWFVAQSASLVIRGNRPSLCLLYLPTVLGERRMALLINRWSLRWVVRHQLLAAILALPQVLLFGRDRLLFRQQQLREVPLQAQLVIPSTLLQRQHRNIAWNPKWLHLAEGKGSLQCRGHVYHSDGLDCWIAAGRPLQSVHDFEL